jgi:hypothetical protein
VPILAPTEPKADQIAVPIREHHLELEEDLEDQGTTSAKSNSHREELALGEPRAGLTPGQTEILEFVQHKKPDGGERSRFKMKILPAPLMSHERHDRTPNVHGSVRITSRTDLLAA